MKCCCQRQAQTLIIFTLWGRWSVQVRRFRHSRRRRTLKVWFARFWRRCRSWKHRRCVTFSLPFVVLFSYFFLWFMKNCCCVSKRIPESWEFIISQELVLKLLGQDDLLSPEEHLQMFDSPLNISMDFGKKHSQTYCRNPVLEGRNPAGFTVLPGRKPFPLALVKAVFLPGRTENPARATPRGRSLIALLWPATRGRYI